MTAYYQYKRKKARWISTAERAERNMLPLEECTELYRQRNKHSILDYVKEVVKKVKRATVNRHDIYRDEPEEVEFEPRVFPKPQSFTKIWLIRGLSLIVGLYCLMIVVSQCFLLFQPRYTLIYHLIRNTKIFILDVILTLFFLVSMVFISMWSLFTINFADFCQLVPKHTDCITMSLIISICSKLANVLCFNFMTLLVLHKQINDVENNIFGTGFATFYSDLTEVPFFGDYYNYILPFCILIVGVLTLLKFHKGIKKITRGIKNQTRDRDSNSSRGDGKTPKIPSNPL